MTISFGNQRCAQVERRRRRFFWPCDQRWLTRVTRTLETFGKDFSLLQTLTRKPWKVLFFSKVVESCFLPNFKTGLGQTSGWIFPPFFSLGLIACWMILFWLVFSLKFHSSGSSPTSIALYGETIRMAMPFLSLSLRWRRRRLGLCTIRNLSLSIGYKGPLLLIRPMICVAEPATLYGNAVARYESTLWLLPTCLLAFHSFWFHSLTVSYCCCLMTTR